MKCYLGGYNLKKIFMLLVMLFSLLSLASCSRSRGIYYLNFKPEADKAWQDLAKKYQEETGIKVKPICINLK